MLKKSATRASRFRFRRSTPWPAIRACCFRCSRFILVGLTVSGMARLNPRVLLPRLFHQLTEVEPIDVVLLYALQLALREDRQQLPGEAQRLLDRAVGLSLVEELLLEVLRELQVETVPVGERLLADDRHQPAAATPRRGGGR